MQQKRSGAPDGLGPLAQRWKPKTPAPEGLAWVCPEHGPVAPFYVPMGAGRWVRRGCGQCQQRQRAQQEHQQREQTWKAQQKRRTFGWLGSGWQDEGLGERTFQNFDQKRQPKAYQQVLAFVNHPVGNLLLFGGFGTGKTHLEAAICNALRESRHIGSLFASTPKLFAAYIDRLNHDEDHWQLIKSAIATPVLVLDDLDKPKITETREELYYLIFDERAKAGRPIIVSTNKIVAVKRCIGEAAADRLLQGLVAIEMVGSSYREEH